MKNEVYPGHGTHRGLQRALVAAALLAVCSPDARGQDPTSSIPGRRHSPPPSRVDRYVITPLGTEVTAIDEQGRVAVNQGTQAFLFVPSLPNAPDGSLVNLGTLGGLSIGKAINRHGHVAGYATLFSGDYRAFVAIDGTMTDLGTLSSDYSAATGINDVGQVVGSSYDSGEEEHGFLWTPDQPNGTSGSMIDLGTLGGDYSAALGINSRGVVVGYAYTVQGAFHAFRCEKDSMTDLGTLGGSYSRAEAINDQGRIVGQAYLPGDAHAHACRWDGSGGVADLGHLGGNYSAALAIDETGTWIVGDATVPDGGQFLVYHAFRHSNGSMVDLNSELPPGSGWVLDRASGVNSSGQIVGSGTLNGAQRGFLLTPR